MVTAFESNLIGKFGCPRLSLSLKKNRSFGRIDLCARAQKNAFQNRTGGSPTPYYGGVRMPVANTVRRRLRLKLDVTLFRTNGPCP